MRIMNKQGFTLIELLIVIAIIGILAGVAVTSYVGSMLKADRSEAYTNLNSLRLLEEQFLAESFCYQPLAGGVCPAAATVFTSTAVIQGFLPGFQPGTGLNFNYAITQNVALSPPVSVPYDLTTVAQTPCFVATATGAPNTRPGNQLDVFAIDCNNNKNF